MFRLKYGRIIYTRTTKLGVHPNCNVDPRS